MPRGKFSLKKKQFKMFHIFSPIFVADKIIIFRHDFVAPLSFTHSTITYQNAQMFEKCDSSNRQQK